MFAVRSLDVLSDLLLQEIEPGYYSMDFGDGQLLEGTIRVSRRHDPKGLSVPRIVEYKHDVHLLDSSRSSRAEHQPGDLNRACQQVQCVSIRQCDVLAVSELLRCSASAGKGCSLTWHASRCDTCACGQTAPLVI